MRILLSIAFLAGFSAQALAGEDVSALLHRQTQEFSDAGQRGDGAVMAKFLDPDVIFFNEGGDRATKADMASNTPSGTPARTITANDWDCKVHGDVAVTSFIDIVEQGTPQQMRFRSVETWRKEGHDWRMIGSETLTLQDDPQSVALDAKKLDEYAGSYEASPDMKLVFTHKGDDLFASLNGGPDTVQKAETRDIVFTPGHGQLRKVFQRGEDGKITGFIYLRGSHSIAFRRVG